MLDRVKIRWAHNGKYLFISGYGAVAKPMLVYNSLAEIFDNFATFEGDNFLAFDIDSKNNIFVFGTGTNGFVREFTAPKIGGGYGDPLYVGHYGQKMHIDPPKNRPCLNLYSTPFLQFSVGVSYFKSNSSLTLTDKELQDIRNKLIDKHLPTTVGFSHEGVYMNSAVILLKNNMDNNNENIQLFIEAGEYINGFKSIIAYINGVKIDITKPENHKLSIKLNKYDASIHYKSSSVIEVKSGFFQFYLANSHNFFNVHHTQLREETLFSVSNYDKASISGVLGKTLDRQFPSNIAKKLNCATHENELFRKLYWIPNFTFPMIHNHLTNIQDCSSNDFKENKF